MTVGFVGLGQIGAPMAGHLAAWPKGLVVYDVVPEACAALAERGAEVATTLAGVAKASVISIMVRDDEQVRAVVGELLPLVAPGTVLAVHSTIRAETAEALAAEAVALGRDIAVLDAPVSGGFVGAYEGNLAVMVGGDAAAVERCREPFTRFADLIEHTGPAGSATRCKIARNLITFVSYNAAFEAQRLAEAAGVDLPTLARVTRHSDGIVGGPSAIMVRDRTGPLDAGDGLHDIFRHTCTLGEKDLDLALELGAQLGVDLPLTRYAREHLAEGMGF